MRGKGNIEFLACKEEITKLISEGYTITQVHEFLKNDKKITIKYGQFYKLLKMYAIKSPHLKTLKIGKDIQKEFYDLIDEARSKRPSTSLESSQIVSRDNKSSEDSSVILKNDPNEQERHW
jgi:hypothetical protein